MVNHQKIITGAAVLIGLMLNSTSAWAQSARSLVHQGQALFKQGDYEAAQEKFNAALNQTPDSAMISFNLGTALYKAEKVEQAARSLEKGLLTDDLHLRRDVSYNLGNAYYRYGLTLEESNLDEAIAELEKSISQYDGSLTIDPEDKDAQHNKAFVQKELERLKQKKEQKDQQEQNQQQDQKQDQSKNKQDKNQQQQDSSSKDQPSNQDENKSEQSEDQKSESEQPSGQDQQQQPAEQSGQKDDDQNQKDQEQLNSEKSKEEAGKDDQIQSASESSDKEEAQDKAQAGSVVMDAKELNQKEAQMLIEEYLQSEDQGRLFNFQLKRSKSQPTGRDW